jgi:hypothetical protein
MAALDAERLDVRADRFGHPQPAERQQRDESVLGCRSEAGGDEQRSDLVAVQADGVGLVVDPGPADMHRRRMGDQAFLLGVAVEAGHRAQPSGDRRGRPTLRLKFAAEGFDVAAADFEQLQMASVAEGDKLAELQRVRVAGQPSVATEEPGQRDMFRVDQPRVVHDDGSRCSGVMTYLPSRWDSGYEATGPQTVRPLTVGTPQQKHRGPGPAICPSSSQHRLEGQQRGAPNRALTEARCLDWRNKRDRILGGAPRALALR